MIREVAIGGTPALAWRILTNRHRFGLFFVGATLSNVGTWCQTIAAILLTYQLTESSMLVGLLVAVQYLMSALLSPVAGGLADRYDRRLILAIAQWAAAVVSAGLAVLVWFNFAGVWVVFGAMALMGVCVAFQAPAQLALMPLMVDRAEREIGYALNTTQFNLARAIGPAVATAVVLTLGVGWAFMLNAVSYLAFVIALHLIRPAAQTHAGAQGGARAFLRMMRAQPTMLALLLVGAVVSGVIDIYPTLGPELSTSQVGDESWTGWFMSAFGAGAVIAAVAYPMAWRRTRVQLSAFVLVEAVAVAVFAVSSNPVTAVVGSFVGGGAFMLAIARVLTLVQEMSPPEMVGRVMAGWVIAVLGGRAVFSALAGVLASVWSVGWAGAVIAGCTAAAGSVLWTALRNRER